MSQVVSRSSFPSFASTPALCLLYFTTFAVLFFSQHCQSQLIDPDTRTYRHRPTFTMAPVYSGVPAHGTVLDIGGSQMSNNVRDRLHAALLGDYAPGTTPVLPDELLYNDEGLAIWADIIFTPAFYQTADEMVILSQNSEEISKYIPQGVTMIDLGAG